MRPENLAKLRSEEPPDLWPEIERRLSLPPPHARGVLRRVPGLAAAAVLACGFGLALFALARSLEHRTVSIGAGQVARVSVPEPQPLVAGEGAIWVVGARSNEGELWRIDPSTDQAQLVAGTKGAWWPAVDEGAAWVTTCHPDQPRTDCAEADLFRIDPSSGTVTSSLRLPAPPMAIAAGLGSVWVSANERLLKIDPQSMTIMRTFSVHTNLLGIADGYLWATVGGAGSTGVAKIDPITGRVVAQISFHDPCTFSTNDEEVLVASCQGGLPPGNGPDHLAGIDPQTGKVGFDVALSYGGLAFTDGHPWIASWALDSQQVQVQQLDPATGHPTGVEVSVTPGSQPWRESGFGAPTVFIANEDGSFWLTHIDANDVVRLGIPK